MKTTRHTYTAYCIAGGTYMKWGVATSQDALVELILDACAHQDVEIYDEKNDLVWTGTISDRSRPKARIKEEVRELFNSRTS